MRITTPQIVKCRPQWETLSGFDQKSRWRDRFYQKLAPFATKLLAPMILFFLLFCKAHSTVGKYGAFFSYFGNRPTLVSRISVQEGIWTNSNNPVDLNKRARWTFA